MQFSDSIKQNAVDIHNAQLGEFKARYEVIQVDPYRSTFTYGRKKIEQAIYDELSRIASNGRVLDVGCGTGFNLKKIASLGYRVEGVEPASSMREEAIANNPGVNIHDADAEDLPFESNSFDMLISIEVIRYLPHPARALSEMARVLKPGGRAVITAAPRYSLNGYALLNKLTANVSIPTFSKVKHSFLSAKGARKIMSDSGFSHVEVHGAFLGPWHVLGRLAPGVVPKVLRRLEPIDDALADRPGLRDLSNHLILIGIK